MTKIRSEKKVTKKAAAKTVAKSAVAKKAAKAQRVTFSVCADVGSKVFLAGDFNGWDPEAKPMVDKKGDGNFSVTLSLRPGEYQYKFVVNGTWCADPLNKDVVPNDLGTFNSVKLVTE